MAFEKHWNDEYAELNKSGIRPHYDNWLEKYMDVIKSTKSPVLDLGCGSGNDTLFLVERGPKVISCDYSQEALNLVKNSIPSADVRLVDISKRLPFSDEEFNVIIADLSLHYFNSETTYQVMREIKRILKHGGHLYARVNSTEDVNHGAGRGEKIEDNYYYVDGYNKRFFTLDDVNKYFSIIGNVKAFDAEMVRYTKPKKLIEIDVIKI